jgi:hypothetical protein
MFGAISVFLSMSWKLRHWAVFPLPHALCGARKPLLASVPGFRSQCVATCLAKATARNQTADEGVGWSFYSLGDMKKIGVPWIWIRQTLGLWLLYVNARTTFFVCTIFSGCAN